MRKRITRTLRVSKYVLYKETLVDFNENLWSFIGAFIGIGLISFFQSRLVSHQENIFLIGSFGATSVLVFGAIQSPLSQPRNLIGGHVISAIIGVTAYKIFPELIWLSAPFAVAMSIVLMQITKTLHPPGGATALIAVIGSDKIKHLGYWYVVSPVFTGCMIILIVALIFNNITSHRSYPNNKRFLRMFKRFIRRGEVSH
jgi:CBS domain-containing membrane protein